MAVPPTITQGTLRSYARQEDLELRVTGGEEQPLLETTPGSWGHRLVRNLTRPFREPDKAQQYRLGKLEVLKTLKEMYGDDIGTKVFRANIGHMEGEHHVSSKYHPITGRHIRQMIDQGDREIRKKYGSVEQGGVRYGKLWTTPQGGTIPGVPEGATTDWMLRKSAGLPGPSRDDPPNLDRAKRFDLRDMTLRASKVKPSDVGQEERTSGERVTRTLLDDFDRRLVQTPREPGFSWTLDVITDEGNRLPSTHTIGLRIDPEDPDKVNVFDVDHGEVTLPRRELAAWLDVHLKKNYSVTSLELYRAEETMSDPRYRKEEDGNWHRRQEFNIQEGDFNKELRDFVQPGIDTESFVGDHRLRVHKQFNLDIDRTLIAIRIGDHSQVLNPRNAPNVMTVLVGGDPTQAPDESTRIAIHNLSIVLNQSLGNVLSPLIFPEMMQMIEGIPNSGNQPVQRVRLSRDEEASSIRIDVDWVYPLRAVEKWNDNNEMYREVFDRQSSVQCSYSLSISLEELRQTGGYVNFTLGAPPTVKMDMVQGRGPLSFDELEYQTNIALFEVGDDRLVSQGIFVPDRVREVLSGSRTDEQVNSAFLQSLDGSSGRLMVERNGVALPLTSQFNEGGDNPEQRVMLGDLGELSGLDMVGLGKLSHLLAPSTGTGIYQSVVEKCIGEFSLEDNPPELRTTVVPFTLDPPDGPRFVDIEYRGRLPQDLIETAPDTVVHIVSGEFDGPGDFETVVWIRVPVAELNGPDLLEHFEFVHPQRLEWRPRVNED